MSKQSVREQLEAILDVWGKFVHTVGDKANQGEKVGRTELNVASRNFNKILDLYMKLLEMEEGSDDRLNPEEIGRYLIEDDDESEGEGENEPEE